MGAGTVFFVDTGRWTCFDQLGAALRKTGFRTVRVTIETGSLSGLVSQMAYSEHIVLPHLGDADTLGSALDAVDIVDVHCTEATLRPVYRALVHNHAPVDVVRRLRWKLDHLDKFTLSSRLAAAGVAVPASLAGTVEPADAFVQLGTPLMVKGRIGFGGTTVAVVGSEAEARRAVEKFGGPDGAFFEAFTPGDNVRYISCRSGDAVVVEATYVTRRRDPTSLGPATGVEFTDDPAMAMLGRAALDALGGDGLANIEAMRGADGVAKVIDVNLRVWGSASLLGAVGLDFVGAYVRLRRGVASTVFSGSAEGRGLDIFPDAAVAAVHEGASGVAFGLFLAGVCRHMHVLGPRYMVGALLLFANAFRSRRHVRHGSGRRMGQRHVIRAAES